MKPQRLLLIATTILVCTISVFGQTEKTKLLRNKLAEANRLNHQFTEENTNLHSYLKQLNQIVSNVRDSLDGEFSVNKELDFEIKRWQETTFNVNKILQTSQKDLSTAQDEIRKLKYEVEILKDPTIIRIYEVSATKVKESLISRLSESSLGFQFEEDALKGNIKVTKQFDSNAEVSWAFDKTIDVLLELDLRVVPHKYDLNRSLVHGSTKLLEKTRSRNKSYTVQDDADIIKFYQDKSLHVLEMNLGETNEK